MHNCTYVILYIYAAAYKTYKIIQNIDGNQLSRANGNVIQAISRRLILAIYKGVEAKGLAARPNQALLPSGVSITLHLFGLAFCLSLWH
jgi:hypothetical protein